MMLWVFRHFTHRFFFHPAGSWEILIGIRSNARHDSYARHIDDPAWSAQDGGEMVEETEV